MLVLGVLDRGEVVLGELVFGEVDLGVTPLLVGTVLPDEDEFGVLGRDVLGVATFEFGLESLTSLVLF